MEPKKNFFRVSHEIVINDVFKGLKTGTKALYLYLCHYRNRRQRGTKQYFIRSDRQIMMDTGLSQRTITTGKKELKDNGIIVYTTGESKRTKWELF